MSSISGIGPTLSTAQLQMAYDARVASLQKDALQMSGEMSQQLIESAMADPAVGQKINIQV